jgi:hypothetical protein
MFSPYHQFRDCCRLERLIKELDERGDITSEVLGGYRRYHNALIYKLRCAKYYVDRLKNALTDARPATVAEDAQQFLFSINRFIDGFFYSGGSALDILAREVLTYFALALPDYVYFRTARVEIQRHRPGDPILGRLGDPPWKQQFSDYRNTQTHELLLVGRLDIRITGVGVDAEKQEIVLALPDNPRDPLDDRTYDRHPDALEYCKLHLTRLLRLIHQTYSHIADRIETTGSLPL